MPTPPLGFITPAQRTAAQHAAHATATAMTNKAFTLPVPALAKGQALRHFDLWNDPDVVADTGQPFRRIWQKTGSCVWAGGSIALFSTICCQRKASDTPTKAFIPFTLHNYASSRHRFGDDGQGEGSMGSTFFQSLDEDGVADWKQGNPPGAPMFTIADEAFSITSREELQWSSWRNSSVQQVIQTTRQNTIASTGECKSVQDIRAMVLNGYGVSFACDDYIGNASVRGSGADAYVRGKWDGRGGHQQSVHAVWEHPNDGPLYWVQNNWPSSTYPKDPAGGPICGCWVAEADVEYARRNYSAEVYGLSHLDWFPAQPRLLNWLI